mgnify:FL=1|jgi:hypothetical protein
MAKLVKCKHCGARIAITAKTCPQCGGENTPPKPAYKRLWFKILIALIVISFIQDLVNPRSTTTESANGEAATSSSIAEKSEVDTASSVADSASEKEEDDADVRKFAKDNHISIELAENLNQVVQSIDLASSVKKISNWDQTADWANGKRYNANVGFKDIQVSVIGDEVYCIKDMTHNKIDNFIYRNENAGKSKEEHDDGTILLSDGLLGDYGERATTKNGFEYIRYIVPAGTYTVESKIQGSSVFMVADNNSDDVTAVLQMVDKGVKAAMTIKSGYHIELSMNTEVVLTPAE